MSPTSSAGGGIKTGGGLSPGIKAALVKIGKHNVQWTEADKAVILDLFDVARSQPTCFALMINTEHLGAPMLMINSEEFSDELRRVQ